jgi:molybdopterin biosynthesis enzyme MoaB
MLVLEAFCGRLSEELKVKLERKNCDLIVISGGTTSQLEALDVLVNKTYILFKEGIQGLVAI